MSTWIIQVQLQNLTWQLARCIVEACKAWQLSAYKSFSPLRSLFLGHNYQRKMFVWQNERPCSRENQALKLKDARCEMNKKKIECRENRKEFLRVKLRSSTYTVVDRDLRHTNKRTYGYTQMLVSLVLQRSSRRYRFTWKNWENPATIIFIRSKLNALNIPSSGYIIMYPKYCWYRIKKNVTK